MKESLSICTYNCRGISTSIPYVRELCDKFNIVLITEHWLHSNRHSILDGISPHVTYLARSCKEANAESYGLKRGQGGVCILWGSDIAGITPMNDCIHDRFCGIRVQNKKGAIFNIFCVYLPAKGCSGDLSSCLDELSGTLENMEEGSLNIICGDLNGDLGSKGGPRSSRKCTREGQLIHDFMMKHELIAANLRKNADGPLNTFYGHNGNSCIDYVLVPADLAKSISNCTTLDHEPLNSSDHNPVTCSINLGCIERTTIEMKKKSSLKWNRLDPTTLQNLYTIPVSHRIRLLVDTIKDEIPTAALIDSAFHEVNAIIRAAEHVIPKSKISPHIKPYWCPELARLKRNKVDRFREWCNAGRSRDSNNPHTPRQKRTSINY